MKELTELEALNIEYVSGKELPFAIVRLTDNILSHSIFDATRPMVSFLKQNNIHDYSQQQNGKEHRKFINTHILTFKEVINSRTSLYKAGTRGDKRMWFGAEILPIAERGNLFVVLVRNEELYIINASKIDIEFCCSTSINNPIKQLIKGK